MAYNYFHMGLHSNAKAWVNLVCKTNKEFHPPLDFIKLLFKTRFGKKMHVAKVGTVLNNLKMDPNEPVMEFAAKLNSNFSQLPELIPRGQIVNIPANAAARDNTV